MAGVGSRGVALLIDSLIQGGVLLVILLIGALAGGILARVRNAGVWAFALLVAAGFLLYYGYFILFEIFWNGQTPGKRKTGLRVIKDNGRRLTVLETIARNLLRIVDQMPGFYAVGITVSLMNARNKRVGDLVAGSLVMRETSESETRPLWIDAQSVALGEPRAPLGAEGLSEEDVILIESFLQRRYQLDQGIRWRMADEIFRRIQSKLTLHAEWGMRVEDLLEAAAHEWRGRAYASRFGVVAASNRKPPLDI